MSTKITTIYHEEPYSNPTSEHKSIYGGYFRYVGKPGNKLGRVYRYGITSVLKDPYYRVIWGSSENNKLILFITYKGNVAVNILGSYYVYISEDDGEYQLVGELINCRTFKIPIIKSCTKYKVKVVDMNDETRFAELEFYTLCGPICCVELLNSEGEDLTAFNVELEFLQKQFYSNNLDKVEKPNNVFFITEKDVRLKKDLISYSKNTEYASYMIKYQSMKKIDLTLKSKESSYIYVYYCNYDITADSILVIPKQERGVVV